MTTRLLHGAMLAVALAGLVLGGVLWWRGAGDTAAVVWAVATGPVVAVLAGSIALKLWQRRVGVDAIALVSMSAALALGEPLAALVVAIMFAGGNVLEDFAMRRAEADLTALTDRTPRLAHRQSDDGYVDVPVAEVEVDDRLLVRAGEVLPVDGALLDKEASLDESALTGEPIAVRHKSGDVLRSGSVNAGETFHLRATARVEASAYAGIVRMVEAAQTEKAPFIRMADRFAILLLPLTLAVAGAAWALSGDPIRGLAVLVVATPCPLILAAPVALIGGVSRAARRGILMKGGAALEALSEVRTALFDKTGTLTEGGARLVAIRTAPGIEPVEALALAASLEQGSHHVLAEAVMDAARQRGASLSFPSEIRETRGAGIEGRVEGRLVRAGSRQMVWPNGSLPGWAALGNESETLRIFVSIDDELAALLVMGDALRPDAAATVQALRRAGIVRVGMVTGDDAATANAIDAVLGLDFVHADCTPAQKVDVVRAEHRLAPTMMVGDGINDAPALAAASVGIALGARGATASSQAADVVLLVDSIDRVAEAVVIARRSRGIAMQSVVVGLALSGLGMVAAAFGYLTPIAGALFQEAIDVAVILNALRALSGPRSAGPARVTTVRSAHSPARQ
ncbi:heavy metal translocating P-type ATPase [Aurantimonas endophytica]|uniref:P-type Zn(2+) transporter n=1 Tax=Aurantimonas endophytica TaxID=1522175 RepID=A0A7W6HH95_9HYPH|nr:heavy metal translocating P-type ATPase [Aurantimonas endophytica]MBB4005196.1 heavy metal translocating P-type ATPase [Aurantimonas endophytica]MCO6406141.1 cadmium-translocating P-type ATPase [Aurantimonas endophytica]